MVAKARPARAKLEECMWSESGAGPPKLERVQVARRMELSASDGF
jgi:hypothetical protein